MRHCSVYIFIVISTEDLCELLRLNTTLQWLLALRIYGTYIPNQKFDSIRILELRDRKEIKHMIGVYKSLIEKCLKES